MTRCLTGLPPPSRQTRNILETFRKHGTSDYIGEKVSQISHAIQAARIAKFNRPKDHHFIAACLLHDIGQFDNTPFRNQFGVSNHEYRGAQILKQLHFHPSVVLLVQNHVKAKRYLVSTDSKYKESLSSASLETLREQGGLLTSLEIEKFKNHPLASSMVELRIIDDLAKNPQQVCSADDLEEFIPFLEDCILQRID